MAKRVKKKTEEDLDSVVEDMDLDEDLEPVETHDPESGLKSDGEPDRPDWHSPDWSDWVLSKLTKKEVYKERPKAEGLLRLVRLLEGDVTYEMRVHHVDQSYAAVTINAITKDGSQYVGSAESHEGNTDDPFVRYPLATAETRAYGRVAKRILGLRGVVTAEEGSAVADLTVPNTEHDRTEGGITETQIRAINRKCKSLGIDVEATVTALVGKHDKINQLSHASSLAVQAQVDEWSRQEDQSWKLESFGSYNDNWQKEF